MSRVVRRRNATLALVAALVAAATDWGYVALIHEQMASPPQPHSGIVPFVSGYIAAIAAVALLAAALILWEKAAAGMMLVAAMTGSAALGFLAIFSIGVALLITAALLAVAASGVAPKRRQPGAWVPPLVGALIALGVLIAGFTATGVFWGT